jgi:hypothetical protein
VVTEKPKEKKERGGPRGGGMPGGEMEDMDMM